MGTTNFISILMLTLYLRGFDFRLSKPHLPNITEMISPAFTLSDSELDTISRQLASRFDMPMHKSLDQTEVKSLLARFAHLTSSVKLRRIPSAYKLSTFSQRVQKAFQNAGLCGLCQLSIALLQLDATYLPVVLEFICDIYIKLSTSKLSNFCSGIIDTQLPTIKFIRQHSKILEPRLACTIILQNKECYFTNPALTWLSSVSTSPKIIPSVAVQDSPTVVKILHLSDLHITMNYQEGSVADCGHPMCCIDGLGNPASKKRAGKWGDYACDLAPVLYLETLQYISDNHKDLSAIYFTGDIVDHAIWNTSKESNMETLEFAYKSLLEHFPDIPVYAVLGNHESHPLNVFAPKEDRITEADLDQQWLYSTAARLWKPWLSDTAINNVKEHGWYAHNHSATLKIIGINSNLCYCYNWWLMYNTTFLNEHLAWLNNELQESENNGQFVHVIGHNSMGNGECIKPWEESYNNIIERYSHIIKGQFVGHTHQDEIKIFYDRNNTPINVAWNGASLTTYENLNPNYKIMYVRTDTMEIVDVDTYTFNMTAANLNSFQDPNWYKLYSMKSEYGLDDLSPQSYDEWCDSLATDSDVRKTYWLNSVRYGDGSIKNGCDESCLHEFHCKIPKTKSYEWVKSYCKDV